jgi:hypothetical protein
MFQQGRVDGARKYLSKAMDRDSSAIQQFPKDGWRALNIALYLLALGDADRLRC